MKKIVNDKNEIDQTNSDHLAIFVERLEHSVILINHLNWEIKDQYLELVDKFIEKKINLDDFANEFHERYRSIEKVAHMLESNQVLLSPYKNKNCLDFGEILSTIDELCVIVSGNPSDFEPGSVEFRILLEKAYRRIKTILKNI